MGTGVKLALITVLAVGGLAALKGSFGGNGLLGGTSMPEQATAADFARARQAQLQADAQDAVRTSLRSSSYPQFRNIRVVGPRAGFTSVCGEVNAQSGSASFMPFIVSYADKVGEIARSDITLPTGPRANLFQANWQRDCS